MSFEFSQFQIEPNSPEGQVIEAIISRDHVSPEEALRTAIRGISIQSAALSRPERNYIKEGKGMFKDPADAKILDEAVAIALEERRRPSTQTLA